MYIYIYIHVYIYNYITYIYTYIILYIYVYIYILDTSICHWVLDVLLQRPQVVKMNGVVSSTIILNTGTPQGRVLSPLLYSLFTNDCVFHHSSVQLVKFADDTTFEGLVMNLMSPNTAMNWTTFNWMRPTFGRWSLNLGRSNPHLLLLLLMVSLSKGWNVSNNLGTFISSAWLGIGKNTVKKAQQRLYFLR